MPIENKKPALLKSPRPKLLRVAVASLLFWIPVITFSKLAGNVIEDDPSSFDTSILLWLNDHASVFYNHAFLTITGFGNVGFIVPATAALTALLLQKKRQRQAFVVFSSVAGASLANLTLKILFRRSRPDLWESIISESSYSFPSGHAMVGCAFIVSAILLAWHTKYRWYATVAGSTLIFLIGISRLYLGVHYPSDVIAGWCAGAVWVMIVHRIANNLKFLRN